MTLCEQVVELKRRLNSVSAMQENCREIYCTTCGGKARSIFERRSEFRGYAQYALAQADLEDLEALNAWLPLLAELAPSSLSLAFSRIAEAINTNEINKQDRFIIIASKCRRLPGVFSESYSKILELAVKSTKETEDESLIETMVLVMGTEILNHSDLLSLALSKKQHPKIAKALYNKLREHLPEVRNYPHLGENLQ